MDDVGAEFDGALAIGGAASVVGLGVEQPAASNATDRVAILIVAEYFIMEFRSSKCIACHRASDVWPMELHSLTHSWPKRARTTLQAPSLGTEPLLDQGRPGRIGGVAGRRHAPLVSP